MEAAHASSAREGPSLPENPQRILRKRLLSTEELFCDWIASADPGQRIEYYRGLLLHDRVPNTTALQPRERVALVALAKRARQTAEDGRVLLVQRRHGEGDYSYIAIKARQQHRAYRTASVRMSSRSCLNRATARYGG
jgi:hypothetical protein